MYHLALEKFSGPLDLLLSLVEDRQLSINEVSLAEIADQYISYLKSLEALPKEELARFLVIAATLILIKSRSLLPQLSVSLEETEDISELKIRLQTYKFFKLLSDRLAELQKEHKHLFAREAYSGMQGVFFPPLGLTKETLSQTLRQILMEVPHAEELETEVIEKAISIEEKIEELRDRLMTTLSTSFAEVRKGTKEKVEVIVSFLAILELMKQGFLMLDQKAAFGDIHLARITNSSDNSNT
jgi:segregation and condensation protein A